MGMKKLGNKIIIKALVIKGRSDVRCMFRNAKDARRANEKTLFSILKDGENSEYGKKYNFAGIDSIDKFREQVPLCTFADLNPYVDRIYYDNEQNVLTGNKIIGFSTTSGSVGKPKRIPITDKQVKIYTKYTVTRMLALADDYYKEKDGTRITHGFGLPLLCAFSGDSPHGLPQTNIVDLAARKYGALYPYILNLPLGGLFKFEDVDSEYTKARFGLEERDSLFIFSVFANSVRGIFHYIEDNWEMLVDDIEKGIVNDGVRMEANTRKQVERVLKPNPERAAELRREFEKGFDETIIPRLWPDMKFMNMIGTSPTYEPYIKEILQFTGDLPVDYSIYGASEGLFAAAYECGNKEQLMLLDSCFYEFIEVTDEPWDGHTTLLIDELEAGKNYEIVITNTSGLYRYCIKDVITVLGHIGNCPLVNFAYREGQLINVTSEKTNMEQMLAALDIFKEKTDLPINNWTATISKGGAGGHYIVYLEGDGSQDYAAHSAEMDEAFRAVNTRYDEFRGIGLIGAAEARNQQPGTHEAWKQKKIADGVSESQVKVVTMLDSAEKKEFFETRVY